MNWKSTKINIICVLFVIAFIIGGSFFPRMPQFSFPFLVIFIAILIFQCVKSIFELSPSKWLKITYSLFLASLVIGISSCAWYVELDRIHVSGEIWDKAWNFWGLYSIRDFEMFLRVMTLSILIILAINCIVFIRNKEQLYSVKRDKSKANTLLLTMFMLTTIYTITVGYLTLNPNNKILITMVNVHDTVATTAESWVTKSISPELVISYGIFLFSGWILIKVLLRRGRTTSLSTPANFTK